MTFDFRSVAKSFICIRKKRGPKTGPCDTLAHIRSQSDIFPIRVALWTLSLRKLLINLSRFPLTPLCFNLNNKPSCDTLWGHSKSKLRLIRRGGGSLKRKQKRTGGVLACVCVRFSKKKKAEIFKMKFYSHSPVYPFDYNSNMKYWNIKQTFMKYYNIQSWWMSSIAFASPHKITNVSYVENIYNLFFIGWILM